jgi:RimJ/RimL family protein N-acetyltransferase
MDLYGYNEKHVLVKTIYGDTITGVADYFGADYCQHEFGEDEDAVIIDGFLIYRTQIASIEEIEVHGCVELRTERLILRRFREEDAEEMCGYYGRDPEMWTYVGSNPYAAPETAKETVSRLIGGYEKEHFYAWVMDSDDVQFGTICAGGCEDGSVRVNFTVDRPCWSRGYATEALEKVLEYLTGNEEIPRVTACCASENGAARRVMEKAGMRLISVEKDAFPVGDRIYDRATYEYRSAGKGEKEMEFDWVDGFSIRVDREGDAVVIRANREGLISLARHLTALADGPGKDHFHLDQYNSLEDGSLELIIDRID